jgi:hypothetical protein
MKLDVEREDIGGSGDQVDQRLRILVLVVMLVGIIAIVLLLAFSSLPTVLPGKGVVRAQKVCFDPVDHW